ncbi:hypothetical protein KPSA3_01525 [Pseudomonas syringae pv. actinidiae]|uniref:Uncharacterized protein n=1 Tax=Pseudomonas syringae pv. actinidiae TaxID=103796 RepID=A0AAN4Q1Y5_PSESF|nr:hypothetical protein KPSA3_01525 [Pseudomonas syringae pv. actinidiae]
MANCVVNAVLRRFLPSRTTTRSARTRCSKKNFWKKSRRKKPLAWVDNLTHPAKQTCFANKGRTGNGSPFLFFISAVSSSVRLDDDQQVGKPLDLDRQVVSQCGQCRIAVIQPEHARHAQACKRLRIEAQQAVAIGRKSLQHFTQRPVIDLEHAARPVCRVITAQGVRRLHTSILEQRLLTGSHFHHVCRVGLRGNGRFQHADRGALLAATNHKTCAQRSDGALVCAHHKWSLHIFGHLDPQFAL